MSEIKDNSIQLFLDELASKSATPGGGSVSALLGAQAAALVGMVCNLTIGKPKYVEVEAQMQALLLESEVLREQLTGLIKADVDVFDRLMAAYGLPKVTEGEQYLRSEAIQAVLKAATEVPLACARACRAVIALSQTAANQGYVGVVSDAGAAVMAAYAGLKSAALNVYINTSSLKDRPFAEAKLAELAEVMDGVEDLVAEIYTVVKDKL
ncbi:MAG: cyclodeaminase/cyclohydrolase family protein [Methylococcaceae bacterium]|nr:cyclodeaminase/cyclohydrolase family protein [Methylococcaceae bacterium]